MSCTRIQLWAFCAALAALLSGPACATGVNATREYLEAYRSDCAFGSAHVTALRTYKVLLVPGYFSDLDPAHFGDQSRWLASIGVKHEKVVVKSRQGVSVNAPIIAAAIRASKQPVILISHSKGSVDALEALRAESGLRTKVKAWVSLQGAFFGSPVADMLLDGKRIDPFVANLVLALFGGTRESALGLTTGASQAYYQDNKAGIDRVVREIPSIAFASALDYQSGEQTRTTLGIPYDLMWREGIRNDGLVPMDAAILPGMDHVTVAGVDHIAPVLPAAMQFDRVRMTKALLLVLRTPFRRLPRNPDCRVSD